MMKRQFSIVVGLALASTVSVSWVFASDNNPRTMTGEDTTAKKKTPPPVYVEKGTAEKPFLWQHPGADPCNPKAGCTLDWALSKSGWPEEVQRMLGLKATTTSPTLVTITRGWKGWMTWGKYSPKFERYTRADFDQVTPAREWSVAYDGVRYVLLRPYVCKNWGGTTRPAEWVEVIQPSPPPSPAVISQPPVAPLTPAYPPLGPNPGLGGVVCVDPA